VAIFLGIYLLFLASRKIREDMELNIKISPWKSMQAGKSYLIFAITLMICMQYFLTELSFDGEKKIPHFDVSFITKKIAIPFISAVNPQFKVLKDETLTVDQFILQTQAANLDGGFSVMSDEVLDAQLPANLTPAQKEMIKRQARENFSSTQSKVTQKNQELIFEIGRKQLSELVGVPVAGDEKISEVFTGLINNKINDYFNSKVSGDEKNPVFPMILAIVLFLTIYPVGLILSIVCFLIAKLIFFILLKLKVVGVRTITVEKEILE
jgi:hypothetical protein